MIQLRLALSLAIWISLVGITIGLSMDDGKEWAVFLVRGLVVVLAGLGFCAAFHEDGIIANVLGGKRSEEENKRAKKAED